MFKISWVHMAIGEYVLTYVALIASVLSILFNLTAQLQVRSLFEESQKGKSSFSLFKILADPCFLRKWWCIEMATLWIIKRFRYIGYIKSSRFLVRFNYGYYVRVNSGNEELTWDKMIFFLMLKVIFTQRVLLIINSHRLEWIVFKIQYAVVTWN